MNNDAQNLELFIRLLAESGLSKDRAFFWIEKLKNDNFSEEDETIFKAELEEQLSQLKTAIAVTEVQLKEREDALQKREADALPYLADLDAVQQQKQETEAENYKKALGEGEKQAMGQMEQIRGGQNAEEMDAIRKRLGKG